MDAMEAINFLATEYLFGGRDSGSATIQSGSAGIDDVTSSSTISTITVTGDVSQLREAIASSLISPTATLAASATPVITGEVVASSSEFVLKRIAKSVGFKIAKKLAESGAPDRHISSLISYLVSPFALLCIGMAIILNRTVVFATTRRPAPLPLVYRVILRSIAIYMLAAQLNPLLRALACSNNQLREFVLDKSKTGGWFIGNICRSILAPPLSGLRGHQIYAVPDSYAKSLAHSLSPRKLLERFNIPWFSPKTTKVHYVLSESEANSLYLFCPAPADTLWDLYRAICIGHFIETFTSVIQGLIPYSETGMTLFEYSVAFQEVQSFAQLSPEILVLSIISALSQIAFHLQGMVNSYRYRLIPSAFFGLTFMSYLAYAVYNGRLLYFPSVCVIGYVPQLVVSVVVLVCGIIYGLACLVAGGSENMQTSLQSIHIDLNDDFYTCLMKLGVISLTSATKATYLTEARSLCAPLATWIEYVDEGGLGSAINNHKNSTKSPYDIEVNGPPSEKGYYTPAKKLKSADGDPRPKELKFNSSSNLLMRVMTALRMAQALFTISVLIVWKFLRIVTFKLVPSWTNQQGRSRAEEFEAALMAVRNNFIYADLNDEYEGGYLDLLNGETLPEMDDSKDYDPNDESESEVEGGYEFESDYASSDDEDNSTKQEYVSNVAQLRVPTTAQLATGENEQPPASHTSKKSSINEFYDLVVSTPDYFLSLIAPKTSEEAEEVEILSRHLSSAKPGPLTRAKYHDSNQEDDLRVILQVLRDRRKPREQDGDHDDEDSTQIRSTICVVCQTAPRQVILWPCRCFAICEECRVALAFKHFKGCVCCRREVDSFSRVYIP
ncbi:putative ubiquitin-protein ligase ASI1 [Sugiyamaella lignohabitans]|uniref:Putative ubiquitin-protein ligase ASI1 n=1 Tax=Sugiyamaella lignohabitans TaxID=796027 RepID=A0A167DJE7_9ASCO|nr:putative ubiquitin-protein ligase ASI1 [Sugiyamaella lignohabitans]ANB12981.1 putative ubiquitin-protein ligase ASI1 [Sugiyamaella lignohabitans]